MARRRKQPKSTDEIGAEEFEMGRVAFRAGAKDCPFPPVQSLNGRRYYWWKGWLHERFPVDEE
jgi:hypothetical protein